MERIKVCGYARISTENEEQMTSFFLQQQVVQDYCDKNNLELVQMYTDKGISGTKLEREGFNRMLEDAGLMLDTTIKAKEKFWVVNNKAKPLFQKIITCSTSRFARTVDSARILDMLKKDKVVEVFFLDSNISTFQMDCELLLRIQQAMDADYVTKLSTSVRRGMLQHAKNARTTKVPFGYRKVDSDALLANKDKYKLDENGQVVYTKNGEDYIVILREEAQIVEKIFKLKLEGKGASIIAKILTAEGIAPPRQGKVKKVKPYKTEFEKSSVQYILKNEAYAGKLIRNKYNYSKINNSNFYIRDIKDWIIKDNAYPALISKEEFSKVQKLTKENRNGDGTPRNNPKNKYSRLLKCGHCGATMNAKQDRHGHLYYSCYSKMKHRGCNAKNISIKELEENLFYKDKVKGLEFNIVKAKCSALILNKIKEIEESIKKDTSYIEINNKRKEKEELENKRLAVTMLANPNMDAKFIKYIQGQILDLTTKIEYINKDIEILGKTADNKIQLIEELKELKDRINALNIEITKDNFLENIVSITVRTVNLPVSAEIDKSGNFEAITEKQVNLDIKTIFELEIEELLREYNMQVF